MIISKQIRCPLCNGIIEPTGYVLTSNPPYTGVKCSSDFCTFKGYLHESGLVDDQFKEIERI